MQEPTPDYSLRPIYSDRSQAPLYTPLALICRITAVEEPEVHDDAIHSRLRLRDFANNEELVTLPVPQGKILNRAYKSIKQGLLIIMYGSFTLEQRTKRCQPTLRFQVDHIARVKSHVVLLGADPDAIARIDALILRLSAEPGQIRTYLTDRLNAMTKTCTTGLSRRFLAAQLMVLLQALSCGMVSADTNDRIGFAGIGSSGLGKKKLAEQACMLAVVSDWTQPASLSQAGMTAVVEQRAGRGWSATPGKLPRTSMGVFVCEDLHRMTKKDLKICQALFMPVAEDGRVELSKAASPTYEAKVALHLNANRQSILEAKKNPSDPQGRANDIVLPYDLFTRMDCMIDMTSGDGASESSRDMLMQMEKDLGDDFSNGIQPGAESANDFGEVDDKDAFELKLLVARLKDTIPQVSLRNVEPEARKLQDDLALLAEEHTARMTGLNQETFHAGSLLRRMTNSMRKLIGASARLNNRCMATAEDVDCAWQVLAYKLEMVKWMCSQAERIRSQGPRDRQVARALKQKVARWNKIVAQFGDGPEVSADEIAGALDFAVRAVQQELREHGILPQGGRYHVPNAAEYAAMQKEWQEGAEKPGLRNDEDDEEPDDLEEEVAETSANPTPIFEDTLLPCPPELQPLLTALDAIVEPAAKQEIGERLLQVATREDGNCYGTDIAAWFIDLVCEAAPDCIQLLSGTNYDVIQQHLSHPDWTTRGRRSLSLHAMSSLPQDLSLKIEYDKVAATTTYPEPLKQDIEALMARHKWFMDQSYAAAMADRKAKREAVEQALWDTVQRMPNGEYIRDEARLDRAREEYRRATEYDFEELFGAG